MAPPTDLGLERRADSSVAALVVRHIVVNVYGVTVAQQLTDEYGMPEAALAVEGLGVLAAVLAMIMVWQVTKRQDEKHRSIISEPFWPP
ncbi:MAG: hypothetical protein QF465_06895 [SAR202 cluster bacterium]|jgi:hypothetical protein|nr:hypothetical protein [SAR202 cluster bacterium]